MPVQPDTIKRLFLEATEKATPAERAAFLGEACAGDETLRHCVEVLLLAHDRPDRLLDHPAAEHLGDSPPAEPQAAAEALAFLAPPQRPDSVGRLGHYEVFKVIGQGGMGIVLQAFDEKLHRVVAIKMLAPQLATSGSARQRFVREARAAAAVTHDNVIEVHAVEDAGPVPYLVMRCVDGKTLQDKLDRDGPLNVTEILRIGLQVADGLAAAHRQGLVHRDVKPANILLENGIERVRITDFGLARAVDDASLTQSGVCAGTPLYMSPEQARGERVDQRSDLFSLGSVLYAMCCGHPPFRAGSTLAVLKRVCEDTPRPLREVNPAVPDWLSAVIDRLMAKAPAERFQTATEVATLLGEGLAHLQGRGPAPLVAPVRSPSRTRLLMAAAVAVIAVGVVTVFWIGRTWGPASGPAGGHQVRPSSDGGPDAARRLPSPAELASRPAAADALDPKDVPAELLAAAGGGDPKKAPPELVAVLAEAGNQGQVGQRCHMYAVAISPDGKTLASGGTDKVVRLWDLATGKVQRELTGHRHPNVDAIFTLAFSPDGTLLASGDWGGTVKLWEVATGRDRATLTGVGNRPYQVAFSPDGKLLAVGRPWWGVQLWDVATASLRASLLGGDQTYCVAFSPDGRTLASGEGLDLHLWDVASGSRKASLPRNNAAVRWVAFHPDGRSLATGATSAGHNLSVRVWDAATLQETRRLEGYTSEVLTGAWRADGQLLATGDATAGTVRLWDLSTDVPRCKDLAVTPPNVRWLHALAFSPEGRHLAVGHPAGMVCVLRLAKRGEVFRVPAGP